MPGPAPPVIPASEVLPLSATSPELLLLALEELFFLQPSVKLRDNNNTSVHVVKNRIPHLKREMGEGLMESALLWQFPGSLSSRT
jgi:hypothetical protein